MTARLDPRIVEQARAADIVAVAERCGAKLKRVGRDWCGACPAGCATADGFAVTPAKRLFVCRPSGAGGDVVDIVMHAIGIEFKAAVEFVTGVEARPSRDPVKRQATTADDGAANLASAARIVRELVPLKGTPGETYLRETRRIDTAELSDVLDDPHAIGWHPSVFFREPRHTLDGQKLGAIVGIMTDVMTARPTGAISRTYIVDGQKIGKAKTLGSPIGIVRLSRDEDVLEGLHLSEGIETTLTALSLGFRPAWSTGSADLMGKFPILAGIESLTLFADNDEKKSGVGLSKARDCANRWRAAGKEEVRILIRDRAGDLNDAKAQPP